MKSETLEKAKGPRPNAQRNGHSGWSMVFLPRSQGVWGLVLVAGGTVGMTVFPRDTVSAERDDGGSV